MSRRGLGRGLDALLPDAGGPVPGARHALVEAPVETIAMNPKQPRRSFDDDALDELAASIRELGVLQPVLGRRLKGGGLELIAGERRLRAAIRAGLEHVPVLVVDADELGSLERALVENLHREDLSPIEEAAAYKQLIDDGGLTQDAVADKLGKSRAAITNALRLLELPSRIQRYLMDGDLTARHGRALLPLSGHPLQLRIAARVAAEGRSVRETEDMVRNVELMSGRRAPSGSRPETRPAVVAEAQRRLSDRLQTRVRVELGKRKGKIVLDFVSLDELERLVSEIVGSDAREATTVRLD